MPKKIKWTVEDELRFESVYYSNKLSGNKLTKKEARLICMNETCKNPKRYNWANINNHIYKRRRKDFVMLCSSCHLKYDKKNKK